MQLNSFTPVHKAALLVAAMRLVQERALGDVAGHEFHGNQWTAGAGKEDLRGSVYSEKHENPGGIGGSDAQKAASKASAKEANRQLRKAGYTKTESSNKHQPSVKLGRPTAYGGAFDRRTTLYSHPSGRSARLVEQKPKYGTHEVTVYHSFGPDNRHLEAAVPLTAPLKTLGDVAGHEFHGNQWTDATVALGKPESPFQAYALKGERELPPVEETVAIADLHPTQSELSPKTVNKYAKDNPDDGTYTPDVYERGGKLYIADGHHRIVAAMKRGEKTIKVSVTRFAHDRALGDVEGHPFHGNQWTSGEGGTTSEVRASQTLTQPGLSESMRKQFDAQEELRLAQNIQGVRGAAKRNDIPLDNIRIESYDKTFKVGEKVFREGGHFEHETGDIVLNAESLSRSEFPGRRRDVRSRGDAQRLERYERTPGAVERLYRGACPGGFRWRTDPIDLP